jgi:hypothetical protein
MGLLRPARQSLRPRPRSPLPRQLCTWRARAATACCASTACAHAEYRAATPEQLAGLHRYRAEIRRLIADGNPDVLAALFPPDGITWGVARITARPHDRLLSATRGPLGGQHTELASLKYDVRDADGERRAWTALVGCCKAWQTANLSRMCAA